MHLPLVQGWGTKLFNDGLHFTPEGQQQLYRDVLRTVETTYPEIKWVRTGWIVGYTPPSMRSMHACVASITHIRSFPTTMQV